MQEPQPLPKLVFTVAEACECTTIGRDGIYAAINSGELRVKKRGRRTLVLHADLLAFLESLPDGNSADAGGQA